MALSHKHLVSVASTGSSNQGTHVTSLAQSEPPFSTTGKSSDNFFTASEGRCIDNEDSDAEDIVCSPSSCEPSTFSYPLVYFNSEFGTDLQAEIEASKVHWSELCAPVAMDQEETQADRLEFFQSLQMKWGVFFMDFVDQFKMGQKIAEGAQAEIFEVFSQKSNGQNEVSVVKLFKEGSSLRNLHTQWPQGMLQTLSSKNGGAYFNHYSSNLYGAMLLQGRFAFWMPKYWGDLRMLIDIKKQNNPNQGPIFTDSRVFHNMLEIADGMRDLHKDCIVHRDLKASNVLIHPFESKFDPLTGYFLCKVADYECSVGVVGTGFWRAPEILSQLKNGHDHSNLCTEKSDVYSYGMTCYEILTGHIPFSDSLKSDYGFVCQGRRPKLPKDIKPWMRKLLKRCWHQNPSKRPTFQNIIDYLCKHHKLDTHVQNI